MRCEQIPGRVVAFDYCHTATRRLSDSWTNKPFSSLLEGADLATVQLRSLRSQPRSGGKYARMRARGCRGKSCDRSEKARFFYDLPENMDWGGINVSLQ